MARRPKSPPSPFNGLSLDDWQRSPLLVEWARKDLTFADALSVVQNGFIALPPEEFLGYRKAVNVLLGLRIASKEPMKLPPADYRVAADGLDDPDQDL